MGKGRGGCAYWVLSGLKFWPIIVPNTFDKMERFKSVLKILKNRYLIVGTAALIWMLFFDQYALVSRMKLQSQIAELKRDRDFYQKEIVRINEEKEALFTDRFALERFAREKYFMKKDNEDLFIVVK